MNIWKKNPSKKLFDYPGWGNIEKAYDKKIDEVFSTRSRYNFWRRNFKHKIYTPYKYRGFAWIQKNSIKRRVRVNMLIKIRKRSKNEKMAKTI